MSYRFVAAERASFPVRTLCRLVGVAVSGFYAWLRRRPGRGREDDRRLGARIAAIVAASRRTYGSPRVHAELRAQGVRVGRKRVERLMRAAGLAVPARRRRVPRTTDSRHDHPVAPNLLARRFAADRPDAVWLADLSYIPTGEGWLYLAAVRDLATREIVGWSMADHLGADLACDALLMAIRRRQPPRGLIHHSDRGVQGGFKRSSQHLDQGGCGGHSKAAFRSVRARRVAVPGPPLRGAAGGSAPVLGVDRGGTLERGRRSWRRRGAGSRDTLVPGGGRHATVTSLAVVEAAA
jgi:transposase InsO family protein